jgi:sugar (pentulose or hexulose) kinase
MVQCSPSRELNPGESDWITCWTGQGAVCRVEWVKVLDGMLRGKNTVSPAHARRMPAWTGYLLAVDCGSTNLKAALFDTGLRRLADCSAEVVYSARDARRVEFDAGQIWQTTVELIQETCCAAAIAPHQVRRIALTSQAQTFALFDDGGRALTPFISWMDSRAARQAAFLEEKLGPDFHAHCSFGRPIVVLQLAKILWLKQNAPELLRQARSVTPLPGWLARRLAGLHAIDRNLAAMSGLYSLRLGTWWREALALCSLDDAQMPALVGLGVPLHAQGRCQELFPSKDLEIVFAGNDQTSGALANNCRRGEIVATLGTALVAYRFAGDRPGPYTETGCWGPYPGGGYYELGVLTQGCVALDWARGQLMPQAGVEAFVACAGSARHSTHPADSLRDPVRFYPERMGTPLAWVGPQDRARRALAVLEGIGFALRRLIWEELQGENDLRSVTVIGGGSKSVFWLQLLADILGCPVRQGSGDALLGAAMMALPRAVPPRHAVPDTFSPDASRTEYYRACYQAWRAGLARDAA